jgi:hypothetical protein
MPSPQDTVQISIRVPVDIIAKFDEMASNAERSRTWFMLRAFRRFFEPYPEEASQEPAEPGDDGSEFMRFLDACERYFAYAKANHLF